MKTYKGYVIKDMKDYKRYLMGRYALKCGYDSKGNLLRDHIREDFAKAEKWVKNLPVDYGQVDIEFNNGSTATFRDVKLLDKYLKKVEV